jgi:hypothetical protein
MRISLTLLLLLIACSKPPQDPSPEQAAAQAQAGLAELDREFGKNETAEDLSGVAEKAVGEIKDISTIAIPMPDQQRQYRTGEPGWIIVEDTRIFSNAVSPDAARQQLLQLLRNKAVAKKVPANIEVSSLITDLMSRTQGEAYKQSAWSGFFRTTLSGVITDEEILKDSLVPIPEKDSYQKTIELKAYVEPVQGQRDPGFYVDVEIKENMLNAGDELVFSVLPSKDCFVYIFNLMADHNAVLMFPNEYMPDNFVSAYQKIQIPDPAIRNHIKFVVTTMPGEKVTSESVYIVCSRERLRMMDRFPQIGTEMKVFSGKGENFIQMQRWLTNIPLNQRVEKNLIYHVSKN